MRRTVTRVNREIESSRGESSNPIRARNPLHGRVTSSGGRNSRHFIGGGGRGEGGIVFTTGGDARVAQDGSRSPSETSNEKRLVAIKMVVGPIPDARNFQRGTAFHDISRPIPREEREGERAALSWKRPPFLSRDISNKRIPPFSSVLTFSPLLHFRPVSLNLFDS